jgi:hypothetical protein
MIPVINDIDRLLQAAPSRYGQAYARGLNLSASARAFLVALDATVSPSAIVFIASRVGFTGGTVAFSTDNGTPLDVDGDIATVTPAALMGTGCEVIATITYQGEQHVARQTIGKQLAFDSSPPPAPANLRTAGTLASIQLSWDATNNPNIGQVEIWRALTNDLAAASAVGTTSGLARTYVDGIGAGGSFFYWIRYISKANVVGPFNAAAGTLGTAGTDAEYLLNLLQNEITQTQLHQDLGEKIELITAPASVVGSVSNRLEQESIARVDADSALHSRIDTVVSTSGGSLAAIEREAQARASADEALASDIETLWTSTDNNAAAIQNEASTRANQIGSLAQQISTVQATVSDPATGLVTKYAAVKTQAEAAANAVGAVQAKYSVQVEADGVVGGTELLGGGGRVDFGVRASSFFVAAPAGTGIPKQVPFVVRTTWTTIGGYSYPPGVYMDSAFIYNLNAERIQSKSIKADKMDVNEISAISGNLGTMTAARIQSAASGQRVVTTHLGTVMLDQFNNRKVLLGDDSLWG